MPRLKFWQNKDNRYLLFLSLLSLIVHFRWFITFGIFSNGDWWFKYDENIRQVYGLYVWQGYEGFGVDSAMANLLPLAKIGTYLPAIVTIFSTWERLLFFLPIVFLAPIGAYKLSRYYGLPRPYATLGSVIYSFNTYFLIRQLDHLNIAAAYSVAPFLLVAFLRLKQNSPKNIIKFMLSYLLLAIFEVRIAFVMALILLALFAIDLFTRNGIRAKSVYFCNVLISGLLIILANSYWLLFLLVNNPSNISEITARGLFTSFHTLNNALALYYPSWTGGRPIPFTMQEIPFYYYATPVFAFVPALFAKKEKGKILFWSLVALVGIVLVKGENIPFPNLYRWIFDNVPGFKLYRESSKFYILISLAYSVLVPVGVHLIFQRLKGFPKSISVFAKLIVVSLVLIPISLNVKPLLTGTVDYLFIERSYDQDYGKLVTFLENDKSYGRVLWVPQFSRWSYYSNTHPRVGLNNTINKISKKDLTSTSVREQYNPQNLERALLESASIEYIIVPIRDQKNKDDFFIFYGDDREYFIEQLEKIEWLEKIDIDTKELVVFKNSKFSDYFEVVEELKNIPSGSRVTYYSEIEKKLNLNSEYSFVIDDKQENSNGYIEDIYKLLETSSANLLTVNYKPKSKYNNRLNSSLDKFKLAYKNLEDEVIFTTQGFDQRLDANRLSISDSEENNVFSFSKNSTKNYFVQVNNSDVYELDVDAKKKRLVGEIKDNVEVFQVPRDDYLFSANFSSGFLDGNLSDCNPYDKSPLIDYSLSTSEEFANFGVFLQLKSQRHIACMSSGSIPILSDQDYFISFDYLYENTKLTGYEITFDTGQVSRGDLFKSPGSWRTFNSFIHSPKGASSFKLTLLAYPGESALVPAFTNFDNVFIKDAQNIGTISRPAANIIDSKLNETNVIVDYSGSDFDPKNLIINPSFEDGLWRKTVQDCNDYDDYPVINMGISKNASNGIKSLQLDAARHIACTGPSESIEVKEGKTYQLSFDYQSDNASVAGYYLGFNDSLRSSATRKIEIKNNNWNTYNESFTVPYNADKLSLSVYSYASDQEDKIISTRYDNFSIKEIPDLEGNIIVSGKTSDLLDKPKEIEYRIDSPTSKSLKIKGARTNFYLLMSEGYHPGWKLTLNNSAFSSIRNKFPNSNIKYISNTSHFKANDWQNGWFIELNQLCKNNTECKYNEDGTYDFELIVEFTPQRWFYLGLLISASVLTAIAGFFISTTIFNTKRAKPYFDYGDGSRTDLSITRVSN